MPRNMSFAMTTDQVRDQSKTVTRRFGWLFLKPGDVINAAEKTMGLGLGGKIKIICQIKIVSVWPEPLYAITKNECIREGFPDFEPQDFVDMIVKHYRCDPAKICNRIEFRYLQSLDASAPTCADGSVPDGAHW